MGYCEEWSQLFRNAANATAVT